MSDTCIFAMPAGDPLQLRKEKALREGKYAQAEQRSHFNHALFPRAVEATMGKCVDPAETIVGLLDDVTSLPGRALVGIVGKSAEGYAKAMNSAFGTDLPEHLPSTDMANPNGLGHDNSSFLTFWGGPAWLGERIALKDAPKILPKAYKTTLAAVKAGNAARKERLAVDAERKGAEYGVDFGVGWLANKPFDSHEVTASDAAFGTAIGAGIDFRSAPRGTGRMLSESSREFLATVANGMAEALTNSPRSAAVSAARSLGKDAAQDLGAEIFGRLFETSGKLPERSP